MEPTEGDITEAPKEPEPLRNPVPEDMPTDPPLQPRPLPELDDTT